MSDFGTRLRREHAWLLATLEDIKRTGLRSSKARAELRGARTLLLAHLAAEDISLYPVLEVAAKTDPELRRTLDNFLAEIGDLSQTALDFFERHREEAGAHLEEEFFRLLHQLKTRIDREEAILIPAFEKIQAGRR